MMREEQVMAEWKSGKKEGEKEKEDGCFYSEEVRCLPKPANLLPL
jgi:hypothetical protein